MIKLIVGNKGEGKTKKMVQMANDSLSEVKGCVIYIDSSTSRMYDVKREIRFVELPNFAHTDAQALRGFVAGALSQNSDIEKIYIDGLMDMIGESSDDDLTALVENLLAISEESSAEITMIIAREKDLLPEAIQKYIVD
ncbi:MAG: hypothetical protein R3Y53_10995 [Bacillota bacterium]